MFRVNTSERGTLFGEGYTKKYIQNYTQPLHHYLAAQFYHYIWEKLTWRFWCYLERFQAKKAKKAKGVWNVVPFTARQDIRCDKLCHRKRVNTEIVYLEVVDYD